METRDYICRYIPRIVLVSKKKKKKKVYHFSFIFIFSRFHNLFFSKIKAKKRIRYNVEG